MNEMVFMIADLCIFLLLFIGFFSLFRSLVLRESVKNSMDRIYTTLASKDAERLERLDEERRKYGTLTGTDSGAFGRFMEKVDNLLIYSGWSITHSWLNTSTFIMLYVVGGGLLLILMLALTGNFIASLLIVLLSGILPVFRMSAAADSAYRNTESQMVLCVNMVANLGNATDSIIVVLQEVAPFLTNPLRTSIARAIATANLAGREADGIRQLCREVEHPLFVQFIRHLEVSSKNSADFREVARDFSGQVDFAIRNANKQKEIFASGRASISLLMVVGAILMYTLATFNGDPLGVVLAEMSSNALGIFVLLYIIGVTVAAILYMILGMRR